jgi:hypothetical protein
MATSPDSVTYADLGYGVLGPLPAGWVDVTALGADPTGNDDATNAFREAIAEVPAGGRLVLPPGSFLISGNIRLPSNIAVTGSGWSSRIIVSSSFVNSGDAGNNNLGNYAVFSNENYEADVLTDSDIIIEGVYFDDSRNPSHGAFHNVKFRMASRVQVLNCRFSYGGDAVAFRAVQDSVIAGNWGEWCRNCFWDCWEQCSNIRVINNFSRGNGAAQHINFNAIRDSSQSGMVADGFYCSGNTCIDETGSSCQFEPLGSYSSNTVSNITVADNSFTNVAIAARGATTNVIITGNRFYSTISTGSAISIYDAFGGGVPSGFVVDSNEFIWTAGTSAFGVVRCEAAESIISNNRFSGPTSTFPAIYSGSVLGLVVVGNYASNSVVSTPRSVAQNTEWHMPNGIRWGTYDNAGYRVDIRVQSGDNNLIWDGTNGVGGVRNILSMVQGSTVSQMIISPPVDVGAEQTDYLRITGNSVGVGPALSAQGGNTDIPIRISSKGASPVVFTNTAGLRLTSSAGVRWLSGSGTPEGSVAAPVGSLYSRTDGGAATSLYVKETGTGDTGWVAK